MQPKSLLSLLLFLFLFSAAAFAQKNYTVKGIVGDSIEHSRMHNTSVAILNARDSTLVTFARTGEDGSFAINGLHKGKFILLLAYPAYADYVDRFNLDSAVLSHNFGHINMQLKSRVLHEVIIKTGPTAIKIKGDTTEFNARAYQIQPNAKVEDLLKQLPGIQVDKDGKITAQGQQVNKVLVDGEEFFGDDPTLVTKNIRADMVDKVQLYDKKSDQAAFTGIDDGKKDKTINIKLKADKKNGMFGKGEAGDGTEGIYHAQLMLNAFKASQKLSIYGTIGNDGKVGLGSADNQKYTEDGTYYFGAGNDLDSYNGRYDGVGFPLARNGGVHFSTKWNNEKESLNTNFKIGSIDVDGTKDNLTQNNLPGTILNSSSQQAFHNYLFRQKLDVTYQIKLDTSSDMKINISGTTRHSTTKDIYNSMAMRNDTMVNQSTRNITNAVDGKVFNANIFYTHKFKKKGRTFSFNLSEAYDQSQAQGYLKSDIDFYNQQGVRDSSQVIDEYKTNDLRNSTLNTNMTYSEPLSKRWAVVLNYGIGFINNSADRKTFNQSFPGNYNTLVDSLSSDYKLNELTNTGGAVFNYKKGKTIINFGTKVGDINFNQTDAHTGDILKRNFVNWMPQANFEYQFSHQSTFDISYNGNTIQPTLNQIQPILVNNDPLNIVLGNPGLTPSFQNRFYADYNSFKPVSGQNIYVGGGYTFTTNPIVSDVSTDPLTGKSISQYFNQPGKLTSNFYFFGNFSRKIEKLDISTGLGLNVNGNNSYNMVNEELNRTQNYTINPTISFSKYKAKKIDFYLRGGPTYNVNKSSLQPNVNNNGGGFRSDLNLTIYLPGKFQIGSDSHYEYTAKTESFNTNFSKMIINAVLAKTFLKEDNLRLELRGNDLLNQNVGFSRNASANQITQNSYTTIKRYFMFSVIYDFSKMGGSTAKK